MKEILVVIGCPIAALLAQAAGSNIPVPGVDGLNVGNLSATGILGWFAWHTTTRTIPNLVSSFRDEMQAEREAHRADRQRLESLILPTERSKDPSQPPHIL